MMAGSSADEIARRHREKIARLERSAYAWEAGAAGERATRDVLAELRASRLVRHARPGVAGPAEGEHRPPRRRPGRHLRHRHEELVWRGRGPRRRAAPERSLAGLRRGRRTASRRCRAMAGARGADAAHTVPPRRPLDEGAGGRGDLAPRPPCARCSSLVRRRSTPLTYNESDRCSKLPSPGAPRDRRRPIDALSETARHGRRRDRGRRSEGWHVRADGGAARRALTTGAFTSAAHWVSDHITEMVFDDPTGTAYGQAEGRTTQQDCPTRAERVGASRIVRAGAIRPWKSTHAVRRLRLGCRGLSRMVRHAGASRGAVGQRLIHRQRYDVDVAGQVHDLDGYVAEPADLV